ncbi:MAG: KpsF/GutQ family sugar-phosphate isomerase [Bdellovibrionales bacterium]|nr:KpsF/GutQ family sugar-phosphate isomerase [Bdellovibrionales bacterium]
MNHFLEADLIEARRILDIESRAIVNLRERIGEEFSQAVELVLGCSGKVVATGMGKSGIIARKLAATLSSTGTPSIYLHPADGSHGDLGVVTESDLVIALSYGGESAELLPVLAYCARKNINLIALTANIASTLGQAGDVTLDIGVSEEACPLGLAPTASTTVSLALCDAIAMAVLKRRGFAREDFAEFHPGGALGRRLLTRVQDVMHLGEALPLVSPDDDMAKVVSQMTAKEVRGVAGVVSGEGSLIGVITDGDIRRRLERSRSPLLDKASELMSQHPKTIDINEMAERALFVMEQFQIQMLFVVDRKATNSSAPLGIVHLQDLLKAKVR